MQEQMKDEGKVKVPNFEEIVKNHFKSKYNKEGYFVFLSVEYVIYDKDYKVYNLDIKDYVSSPQNRKVTELLPFFIEQNFVDDVRAFSIKIPGITNVNDLIAQIKNSLPKGATFITNKEKR